MDIIYVGKHVRMYIPSDRCANTVHSMVHTCIYVLYMYVYYIYMYIYIHMYVCVQDV